MKLLLGINLILVVAVLTFLLLREDGRAPDQNAIPRTVSQPESPQAKTAPHKTNPSQRVEAATENPTNPPADPAREPATAAEDPEMRIEGVVLSPEGKPMHSWFMSLWQDGKALAQTNSDKDGHFRFQVPHKGEFELRGADNMQAWRERVLLFPQLRVRSGDHKVRVQVEWGESGTIHALLTCYGEHKIPDRVQVHVLNQEKIRGGQFRVVPCQDGKITITGIPEGDYTLEFFVPDLQAEALPVLKVRRKAVLDLGRIYFHPQGAIAGKILDSRGQPLEGIGVYLHLPYGRWLRPSNQEYLNTNRPTTRTDSNGRFRLTGYRDPWTPVVFTAKGYAPIELHLTSADQARTLQLRLQIPAALQLGDLPTTTKHKGREIRYRTCTLLALRLSKSYSLWKEHPLLNHSLKYGLPLRTNPTVIPDLPPGRYRVRVGVSDKIGEHRDIELTAGKTTKLTW
jgi:protocatechuate 3,4-dioxygenase beta subunit